MRVAFLAWSSPFLRLLRFFAADPVWRTAGRLRIPEWKSRAVTGVSLAGNTCRLGNEVRGRKSEVGGRGCFQFSAFQLFSVCLAMPTVVGRFHGHPPALRPGDVQVEFQKHVQHHADTPKSPPCSGGDSRFRQGHADIFFPPHGRNGQGGVSRRAG